MPLRLGADLPTFDGATNWYNSTGTDLYVPGKPLLVHFWAVSCYLCKNNFPTLTEWKKEYGPKGLSFVAVHMPRQDEDTNLNAVEQAIKEYGVTEPCAVDNEHAVKDAFGNDQAWVPAYFLFDAEGKLKSRAAGEAGLGIIRTALERMFALGDSPTE